MNTQETSYEFAFGSVLRYGMHPTDLMKFTGIRFVDGEMLYIGSDYYGRSITKNANEVFAASAEDAKMLLKV